MVVLNLPGRRPPWITQTAPTTAELEWMWCVGGVPTVLHWSQRRDGLRKCIAHICGKHN